MGRQSPRERYLNDPMFHAFTDMLGSFLHKGEISPLELQESALLACMHHAQETGDLSKIFVDRSDVALEAERRQTEILDRLERLRGIMFLLEKIDRQLSKHELSAPFCPPKDSGDSFDPIDAHNNDSKIFFTKTDC